MRAVLTWVVLVVVLANQAAADTYGGKDLAVTETFAAKLAAVCSHPTMVLTAAARTACESGSFPRLTAAAKAFINSGAGAEFNTLMRQLPPYEHAAAVTGAVTATATATPVAVKATGLRP